VVLTLTNTADSSRADDDDWGSVEFGPWTAAVNLGPIVNSGFVDAGPGISRDGLALYFHSTRHSAGSEPDLYVSRRAASDLPWEAPVTLGGVVNSPSPDFVPNLSRDGRQLFFASQRFGNADIFVSRRLDVLDDFAWGAPLPLPAPVNGSSFDAGSSSFEPSDGRPQLYFASDRANGGGTAGLDIYVAEPRGNGTWTTPVFVAEVNSAAQDSRPVIRVDGLEMIFTSTREGNADLYASRRDHVWEPWSAPERIAAPVNTGAEETQAALSANGRTLYFASTRPGGNGLSDLYASTRTAKRRNHDH
jgi:hypothetical protein